ncbi:MAG: hypothetical protein AAF587_36140 [Bacteroidota bacterium]
MPIASKSTLKSYFETGDVPSESNFVDLIDSCYNEQSLNWRYHSFIPDNLSNITFSENSVTEFGINYNANKINRMFIPIPPKAKSLNSLRLYGEGFGSIKNIRLFYYTDFSINNPSLSPITYFNGSNPGTRYTLIDQDPNISLTFALFDETVFINQLLPQQTYRYLSLELKVETPQFIFGRIYLNPFGLQFE